MAMRNNHAALQSEITKLVEGLEHKLGDKTKTFVNGVETTVAEVTKNLKSALVVMTAADKLKAQLRQAVQKQRTAISGTSQMMLAIQRYLQGMYGPRSEVLLEFGLSPLKTRTKSSKTKAATAAKAEATREARLEVGSQKRKEIVATNGAAHGAVQSAAA